MKRRYVKALVGMEQHNQRLNAKISCFRKLEELGNVGIGFDEMDCESIIQKLSFIESSPKKIWNAFEDYYSRGFFYPEIEREFGITPETHDKLVEAFDGKVEDFKRLAQSQIDTVTEKCERENARLQYVVREREMQMQEARVRTESEMLNQRLKDKEAHEFKYQ